LILLIASYSGFKSFILKIELPCKVKQIFSPIPCDSSNIVLWDVSGQLLFTSLRKFKLAYKASVSSSITITDILKGNVSVVPETWQTTASVNYILCYEKRMDKFWH